MSYPNRPENGAVAMRDRNAGLKVMLLIGVAVVATIAGIYGLGHLGLALGNAISHFSSVRI